MPVERALGLSDRGGVNVVVERRIVEHPIHSTEDVFQNRREGPAVRIRERLERTRVDFREQPRLEGKRAANGSRATNAPFSASTLTNGPSRCSRTSPTRSSAGNLFGTHRIDQPGPSGFPLSRYARTSGGVMVSWPSQNGQRSFDIASFEFRKAPGRWERAAEN